jgi:hypothetical protein
VRTGRPRISPLHTMSVGQRRHVEFCDLERTKVLAYRLNSKGEKRFSFFTEEGKKLIKRVS